VTLRRGNSALYSSIRYLGEDTDFDTKLIGWTGEISPKCRRTQERKGHAARQPSTGVANGQLDEDEKPPPPPKLPAVQIDETAKELVSLTKDDKHNLEKKLNSLQKSSTGKKYELVPVWTLEDSDGQAENAVAETFETQGRYRKYAEQGIESPD
jgi:hypothetical protein